MYYIINLTTVLDHDVNDSLAIINVMNSVFLTNVGDIRPCMEQYHEQELRKELYEVAAKKRENGETQSALKLVLTGWKWRAYARTDITNVADTSPRATRPEWPSKPPRPVAMNFAGSLPPSPHGSESIKTSSSTSRRSERCSAVASSGRTRRCGAGSSGGCSVEDPTATATATSDWAGRPILPTRNQGEKGSRPSRTGDEGEVLRGLRAMLP